MDGRNGRIIVDFVIYTSVLGDFRKADQEPTLLMQLDLAMADIVAFTSTYVPTTLGKTALLVSFTLVDDELLLLIHRVPVGIA